METAIIAAIITGTIALVGIVVSVLLHFSPKKPQTVIVQTVTPPPVAPQEPNNAVELIKFPYSQNKYFTGRTEKLEDIRQNLQDEKCVYVTGMGGVGKSAVALEYAYRHKGDYDVIRRINAEKQNEAQVDFKNFALEAKLIREDEANETIILRRVQKWLNDNPKWLFIYDNANVEDFNKWLKQYLPWDNTCGDVIITTRSDYFPVGKKIKLGDFEEAEALEFLEKRTGKSDAKAKELVNECLSRFPLALEQAAAYLVVTPMAYEKYIEAYAEKLELAENLIDYNKSIYVTLQISIDAIKKDGARQMLNMCAYFAPDRIPLSLFVDSKIFPEKFKINTDIEDIVAELAKYSLLKHDKDNPNLVYIHRLLQETVRRKHKDSQWLTYCFDMAYDVFSYEFGDKSSMDAFVQNVSHALEIARHAERTFGSDNVVQEKIAGLYFEAGQGFAYGGQYIEALECYKKARTIYERVLGTDHPDTATTYNDIAGVYYSQGEYARALEWYEKARTIKERVLGTDHPSTATTYNNIALVYYSQGEYARALEWHEKARTIYERVLGTDHPSTATTYDNIAGVYYSQGEYAEALEWYKKALTIYAKAFGENHELTEIVRDRIKRLSGL
jgi:tetratricopeptide (TPR) repeat protein